MKVNKHYQHHLKAIQHIEVYHIRIIFISTTDIIIIIILYS